uniref:Acyl carrier protein n=1 Tax=Salix viminalis TaxID=40686 RepID=A0A6N2LAP0_SALVM
MAAVSATCLRFQPLFSQSNKSAQAAASLKPCHGWAKNTGFPSLKASRFRVSCAAKPETVDKVIEIVRKQLALTPETELTNESKFAALGADSLDTVEIVMALEEEFDINVEEESSQNITTVREAADMIDKLVQEKSGGGS